MFLPTLGPEPGGRAREITAAARRAEDLGFDSVWTGDPLIGRSLVVEGGLALATAAAVTDRVGIGFGVLHLPLHPLAQVAQRIGTLQHLSEGRLLLGVGSGGAGPRSRWRGGVPDTTAWQATGLPYEERYARLDRALELLPDLLGGAPVRLAGQPDAPELTLSLPVPPPPLLVGGTSPRALRRAVTHRAEWFPALLSPAMLAAGRERLAELAAEQGRPAPGSSVALPFSMGPATPSADQVATLLTGTYGIPAEQTGSVVVSGEPAQAAERLAAFAAAGAHRIVLSTGAEDWRAQYDLLAEARALL
ncbi:hypothetical protein ACZ90_48740 [Streptomyces albus subsp. albus]|nr:hypothetical protein ACZ90_48740 [Streptomyces albus subsp. albus]